MDTARRFAVVPFVLVALTSVRSVGQLPQGEPFTTAIRMLKDGLYVIPGYDGTITGGNTGVRVTSDAVVIVDTNKVENIERVLSQVRSVTPLPIRYEIGTHSHADHSGGNPAVGQSVVMIAQRNMRDTMIKNRQAAPPTLVYDTQMSLFVGGAEVRVYHFGRGHTNGDSIVYFPDLKTVRVGDLVVWGKRSDGTTPSVDYANGGSLAEWILTLDRVLELDFDSAIPGHGPVLTKEQVRQFRQKLTVLEQRMRDAAHAGVKKPELSAKVALDDLDWPFPQRALEAVYDEVASLK